MKFKNIFLNLFFIAIIVAISLANYQTQNSVTTNSETTLKAGKLITSELASSQKISNETLFDKNIVLDILSQKNAQGIRIYESQNGLVLVGTDKDGNDLFERFAGFGQKGKGQVAMIIRKEKNKKLAKL